MSYVILRINGVPICGSHGEAPKITVSRAEAWGQYLHHEDQHLAQGRPWCPVRKLARWEVNGELVDPPEAWFLTIEGGQGETPEFISISSGAGRSSSCRRPAGNSFYAT